MSQVTKIKLSLAYGVHSLYAHPEGISLEACPFQSHSGEAALIHSYPSQASTYSG